VSPQKSVSSQAVDSRWLSASAAVRLGGACFEGCSSSLCITRPKIFWRSPRKKCLRLQYFSALRRGKGADIITSFAWIPDGWSAVRKFGGSGIGRHGFGP